MSLLHLSQSEEFLISVVLSYLVVGFLIFRYKKYVLNIVKKVFQQNRLWGSILYILVTTIATMLFAPVTPFNMLAMYLWPPWEAFLMSLAAHVFSASVEFYIARTFEPDFLQKSLAKSEIFQFMSASENLTSWQWLELATLTRASPNFPYALISYLWGFTKIPYLEFVIGTTVGCIPYLLAELYLIYSAGEIITGNYSTHVLVGIVVTIVMTFYIEHKIKGMLKERKKQLAGKT
jgi:uncharacterized membrane protein YdjX (TVP38/TMEM64 family)